MSLWLVDQNAHHIMSQNINHNIIMLQRSYSEVCKQTTLYTWEENKQMTIHSVHVYGVLVSSWGRGLPQTAVPTHSWFPHKARPDTQQVCLDHYWSISAARHTLSQGTGVACPCSPRQPGRLAWQQHWGSQAGFPGVSHPGRSSLQAGDPQSRIVISIKFLIRLSQDENRFWY